jgi:HSP20 family protein
MERLRRELDRAVGDGSGRPVGQRIGFLPGRAARQYPLVNVHDDGDRYHIEALAPGLDPAQLDITVVRNMVTISGEKPGLSDVSPERVHRSERSAGKFVRTVQLPTDVDAAQVDAEYRNGLLHITLPRAEAARPRRVEIRSQ